MGLDELRLMDASFAKDKEIEEVFVIGSLKTWERVPGLPIRNCADISNNLVPRGTKVNTVDVKAKAFFERLYLVPGLRKNESFVTSPSAPDYFSIFLVSMIRQVIWPSPGTLIHLWSLKVRFVETNVPKDNTFGI